MSTKMSAMRTRLLAVGCVLLSVAWVVSVTPAKSNWAGTYGGTDNDYGLSVQQIIDGGYIIVGGTYK